MKYREMELQPQMEKLGNLLAAFSVRDIQVANTLLGWLSHNNVTSQQFQDYVRVWIEINRLESRGYFSGDPSPESGKYVLSLERAIQDPAVRRFVRNMRLNTTPFSAPGQRRG